MTRIGSVTISFDNAKHYAPAVFKHVIEDGEVKLAKFKLDGSTHLVTAVEEWGGKRYATYFRYRRVA